MNAMTRSPVDRLTHAPAIVAMAIAAVLALVALAGAAEKKDSGAILTKEQWAKIVRQMDQKGNVRDLPFKVAESLGLTKGSQVMTVHELALEREGYQHGIYRSVDPADTRIILAFRTPEKRWSAFVTDSRFELIAAIAWNAGEAPVAWPKDEALPAFRNELAYWSVVAELL
jgi:hypothetical protein